MQLALLDAEVLPLDDALLLLCALPSAWMVTSTRWALTSAVDALKGPSHPRELAPEHVSLQCDSEPDRERRDMARTLASTPSSVLPAIDASASCGQADADAAISMVTVLKVVDTFCAAGRLAFLENSRPRLSCKAGCKGDRRTLDELTRRALGVRNHNGDMRTDSSSGTTAASAAANF